MHRDMEQWSEIRRRVLVEGVSRRQIIRETGLHWDTFKKIEPQRTAGLSATKAPAQNQAGALSGAGEADIEGGSDDAAQTATHGQAALGTVAGRRIHRGLGSDQSAPRGLVRGVTAFHLMWFKRSAR